MLTRLGLEFITRPVDVDESPEDGEPPERYVLRLATAKARAAAGAGEGVRDEIVLAADTIVVAGGELLGKPRDEADAELMLERLSAREHEVLTGVAVLAPEARPETQSLAPEARPATNVAPKALPATGNPVLELCREIERTRVRFAEMSKEEIAWYVASGEPLDKAGAYAVQGLGALFVKSITGNYSNVVGLPLPLTYRLLREAGFSLLNRARRLSEYSRTSS